MTLINDWEITAYWEESEESEALANKHRNSWEMCSASSGAIPQKTCNFYPHLRLEIVFPALKLPQNYLFNMSIGSPSPSYILCLKNSHHNETKYESQETPKIQT